MARDDMFAWIRQKLRHDAPEDPPTPSPTSAPLADPQSLLADEHNQEPQNTQIPGEIAHAQTPVPSYEVAERDDAAQTPEVAAPDAVEISSEVALPDVPEPSPKVEPVDVFESSPDVAPVDISVPSPEVETPDLVDDTGQPPIPINEQQRVLEALTKVRKEPKPLPGMPAMELAPPRFRRAYVVSVKAGGRRITARIRDIDRIYCYTLRRDGTYRLEGVPTKSAPRLLLDIDV